jgi:hypothetical protein
MAATSGPSIVDDGLVLALDAADRNSFKGEVTTNLLSNGDFSSGVWTSYNGATNTIINLFDVPPYLNTSKRVLNSITNSTQNFGNYGGIQAGMPSLTTSVTYTISYYARCLSGTLNLKFSNQNGAGDESNLSHSKTITTTWTKYTHTAALDIVKNILFIWNSSVASGIFQITDIQIEAKSYATTFVNGTRGTTVAAGGGWADLTGAGNNGELLSGVRENSGNLGSLSFDGTDDYIIIPENSALNTQTPTVEVWVKTNATSQNGFWFEKGQVNTQYSLFQEGSVIQWRQNIGGVTNLSTTTATYMNTTNWYQVVGTYTSGARRLYINGTLVNSDTQTGSIATNTNGMSIGVYGGFNGARGYYYNGNIASVKIYNRALTAAEIQQNFNETRSRFGI